MSLGWAVVVIVVALLSVTVPVVLVIAGSTRLKRERGEDPEAEAFGREWERQTGEPDEGRHG